MTALLQNLYYIVLAFLFFRVIDVDILVAQVSDPLTRDTLHWRILRFGILGIMPVGAAGALLLTWLSHYGTAVSGEEIALAQGSVYFPFLLSGIAGLLFSARRSGDSTFKRNLKWLGFFFLAFLVTNLLYYSTTAGAVQVSSDLLNAIQGIAFAPAAYCLYRSAKSLAPLGRIAVPDHLT